MEIVLYTSYDEIRAVLGVNDVELADTTLALGVYANNLSAELEDIDTAVPAKFEEVDAIDETQRTDAQRRFYDNTRLFATYAVAKQLLTSLPMFGPKDVSDSKAAISRFSDSPYKETSKKVCGQYDLSRARAAKAFGDLNTVDKALPTRVFAAVSTPTTDRVTG